MKTWTSKDLNQIGSAEELQITTRRKDGTLRKAVTIWVVSVGDELFVRSYTGRRGAWYRATQINQKGSIRAGGVEKEVTFIAERDSDLNDQIDSAYRRKYGRYPQYVPPMLTTEVRSTTIKLVPDPSK